MTKQRENQWFKVYINDEYTGRIANQTDVIANLIANLYPDERCKIVDIADDLVVTTRGSFLDNVPNQKWLKETLLPELVPLQTGEKELQPVIYQKVKGGK